VQSTEFAPPVGLADFPDRRRVTAAPTGPPNRAKLGWKPRYVVTVCLLDLLVGFGCAVAALGIRFGSVEPYQRDYLWITAGLPFAWLATLALNRAYESRHLFVGGDEYARVFRSGVALTAALAVASFSVSYHLARGYLLIAMPLLTATGITVRYVVRQRLHRSWARGHRLQRVLLVGPERTVVEMARRLRRERYHGLDVIGTCLPDERPRGAYLDVAGQRLPVLGTPLNVPSAVNRAGADTVVVLACPEIDGVFLRRLAWQIERDDIDLIVASTLVDVAGDRTTIRPVDGLPMLHVEHPRLKGVRRVIKGAFDRSAALLLLALAMPFLLAMAALVRYSPGARGPAIFRQERVGKNGRLFRIYKFRTMYLDAEERLAELMHRNDSDGELFKMREDPRVTPIGRWLRRFSIDEVPQLLNVLKGDMSLVGPRPPLAREVARYPADMRRRLVVKPGLTGLWQVSGRSNLSWEESIRLDLSYVENWSLAMDMAILARTATAVIRSSGAY
jgi:exopolysaccharide biosynthesis polyprenyl glycosylphosphotransferase